jgi:hypothetical protein
LIVIIKLAQLLDRASLRMSQLPGDNERA